MKSRLLCWMLLVLAVCGCSEEDFTYPSVKLEFVTAYAGPEGSVASLLPDKGELLTVEENRSLLQHLAGSSQRVIANYEPLSGNRAIVYSMAEVLSPTPEPAGSLLFANGIKTDPVGLESIWLGRDYLNMVLLVRVKEGLHYFHFVEERCVELDTEVQVDLLLYHDAGGDMMAFTQNVYASVPLSKYLSGGKSVRVTFSYHDEQGERVQVPPFVLEAEPEL